MNTPKDSTGGCCPPPPCSASSEAVQYADYVLNHYARDSYADKLCLARDLERHGWEKSQYANKEINWKQAHDMQQKLVISYVLENEKLKDRIKELELEIKNDEQKN